MHRALFLTSIVVSVLLCPCASGKSVYVSSSIGNDVNTGFSENSPLKLINTALKKDVDTIYLKAGDVFYENIQFSNKALLRYGEGTNPLLSGYKKIIDNKWVLIERNVWRLDLTDKDACGHIINNSNSSTSIINNVGFIHEIERNVIHGRKVSSIIKLEQDWDFCQPLDDDNDEPFQYIYLYYKKDPNAISLEYSTGTAGIIISNGSIDGINIQGFGFGISLRYSGTIRNCWIDAIGGRTLVSAKNFICDGNGIGIWIDQEHDTKDVLIERCYISRVFDAGICMQGTSGGTATARNVICRDNLIVNCCQAWEDVLENNPDRPYENCVFENNYAIHSGRSFWGYSDKRYKYCHVLGNNRKGRKNMVFRNNTFVDGNYYCSALFDGNYMSNIWQGNRCYLTEGDYLLCHCDGYRDVLKTTINNLAEIRNEYGKLTGDWTTMFLLIDDKSMQIMAEKTMNEYFGNHTY